MTHKRQHIFNELICEIKIKGFKMFKKEKMLSLTKLFLKISMILILFLTLIFCPNSTVLASETINAKKYIKDKFPSAIYNIYLASLDELDPYEKEFIDILQNLPEDTQRYFAKEVYDNGFTQELLEKIRRRIVGSSKQKNNCTMF